jgi:hypothetical protein
MAARTADKLLIVQTAQSTPLTFNLATAGTTRQWFLVADSIAEFSVEASWPSTGTPVGAFTVEVTNDVEATSGTPIAATATASFVAQQPGGESDAGSFFLDNVPTCARFFCVAYTRVSGSAGATATVRVSGKVRG